MGTETRKLEDGKKSDGWHVRNEQGETFGPVGFETLKAWACDGRLGPTNEVSLTGSAWQLATSVRELEMDWVAEVTSGTFYGPIHRRAMEELVKDSSIAAQSAFFARRGLADRSEPLSDGSVQEEAMRRLAAQVEQASQRAAAGDAQVLRLREQLAAQSGQARQQAASQAEEAQRRAALEKQLREQLAAQSEQAQRQTALEKQLRDQLAAQSEQARRQAALQAEEAQRQLASHAEQLRAAQQQRAASIEQAEQAQRQAAACEEQVRFAQQQAAREQQMRQQAVSQAEEAQRQAAAREEQVRAAQQQAAASLAQAEQARQQAAAAEARLCELAQQISEQAEQARALQQQWNAKSDALAHELKALHKEQSEALATVAKVRSERDAQALALETQVRAFDAERQELQAALGHAKAELAIREVRFAQVEHARAGSEGADAARGALESQVRVLSAELNGLQQALASEKVALENAEARCKALEAALSGSEGADAARAALERQVGALGEELIGLHRALSDEKVSREKAESRCTALEAALEEARARSGREASLADVSAELKQVRRQVEELCVQCRQAAEARAAAPARRADERVVVETVEAEVLPPEGRPKPEPTVLEAQRVTGEWRRGPAEAPPAPKAGRAASGLSMAELEQQARRELERLGAQGVNLFKKKR